MSRLLNRKSHWPIWILYSLTSLLNLALPMVLVRILPPSEIGEYKIFFLYIMAVPYLTLTVGLVQGLFFWVGQGAAGQRLIHTAWKLLVIAALAFSFLGYLAYQGLGYFFHWPMGSWSPAYQTVFFAAMPPTILMNFYDCASVASGRIWQGSLFSSGFELLRIAGIGLVALQTHDLLLLFWAHTLALYLRVVVGSFLGFRQSRPGADLRMAEVRAVFRFAGPVSLAALFDLLVGCSDRLILSQYISSAEFAIYSMGCLAIPPLMVLEEAVNKVLMPRLSQAFWTGEDHQAAPLYRNAVEELSVILLPSVIGLIVFAQPIIELFFTPQYLPAARYLRIYAFFYLLHAIPIDVIPRARGDGRWIFRTSIIFGTLSLCVVFIFTRLYSTYGALLSSLACQAGLRVYALMHLRRKYAWAWSEMLPLPTLASFLIKALALASGCILLRSWFSSEIRWLLACAPAFALIYLLSALPQRIRQIW